MNVYEMYRETGQAAGFWIRRNSWEATVAYVVSVCGQVEGELPGEPPYHGNGRVVAIVVDLWTGELLDERSIISCPGTNGYRLVERRELPWFVLEREREARA